MARSDPMRDVTPLLADQIRYYEDRAPEYEDLWFRRGQHDRGPEFNQRWFQETAMVERAVDEIAPQGSVLEIGCGSGLWTRRLAPKATRYVALDSSPRMLDLNRERYGAPHVEYILADVFEWTTTERFDLVFLGFFVSHIPPELWESWWHRIATLLNPNGFAFLVDDAAGPNRPYSGDVVGDGPPHAHRRRLSGGREYTIVKVFHSPEEITEQLSRLGWRTDLSASGEHFLYGSARPQ
jgi:demethylmenaquinone methyltransferase/2-methoxy-6-polyprenyl-1,4-benzoquinol methylase